MGWMLSVFEYLEKRYTKPINYYYYYVVRAVAMGDGVLGVCAVEPGSCGW